MLRYNWPIPGVAYYCVCGIKNSLNLVLSCKKGGYVTFRCDLETHTQNPYYCQQVPNLILKVPRLEIVATGLYGENENRSWMLDVRITHDHPNVPLNMADPVDKLLLRNVVEKKTKYSFRVTNTENVSFIP